MDEKEIEIGGCLTVPSDVTKDDVIDAFIQWVESKGWYFGGGFRELSPEESGYIDSNFGKGREHNAERTYGYTETVSHSQNR